MSDRDQKSCHINITINAKGDVNIYNCSSPTARPCEEEGETPVSPGACVPLSLGAKPKQSQRRKLDTLLAGNPVPSALAASFIHVARRFVAGRSPANLLEEGVFDRLRQLSPALQRTLSCTLGQFDSIAQAERSRLFETTLLGDLGTPFDRDNFLQAFGAEIAQRATQGAFDEPDCQTERPGQVRVFDPGTGEIFASQVLICRINGLRTSQYEPPLDLSEFLPEELQQQCVPEDVNGEIQITCNPQIGNCPGRQAGDGTCFRVQNVDAGQAVILEGVNYFSVDTRVRLHLRDSTDPTIEVDAHVCGDQDTPLTEEINGNTVLITDCRVHDRLTFVVPADLPVGIYEVAVAVPNNTGIPNLTDPIVSNVEYICVLPPVTARFRIEGQKLICHDETSPSWLGSDEVAIRFLTTGIRYDGTFDQLEYVEADFDDVDSGDKRNLTCVPLPEYDQPLAAVTMVVMGYEIDDYDTYLKQIETFMGAFLDIMSWMWKIIVANTALDVIIAVLAASGWPLVIAAIGAAIFVAIAVVIALWAPADLIIQDVVSLSACDLDALTSDAHPAPPLAEYTTAGDIKVKARALSKGNSEYLESREYVSDDEGSKYEVTLRYSRVS